MQVLEIGTRARAHFGGVVVGRFDLQDVGAPVGELAHGGRSGARARKVDDFEAGERKLAHTSRIIMRPTL